MSGGSNSFDLLSGGAVNNVGVGAVSLVSGEWFGRIVFAIATYLTLPVQLALYPIAGIPAFVVGYFVFQVRMATGAGYDASMNWAWTTAWLIHLAATRFEIGFEAQNPSYGSFRHLLRLALIAIWSFYFDVTERGDTVMEAIIITPFFTAIMHFILRSKWLKWIWNSLQFSAWLRKERPPRPV